VPTPSDTRHGVADRSRTEKTRSRSRDTSNSGLRWPSGRPDCPDDTGWTMRERQT